LADIFDEVENDLRAERARRTALRYGGLAAFAAVLVVGAAAGWQGWRWYQARQDQAAAAVFLTAMRDADSAGPTGGETPARAAAAASFARLAEQGPEGYRTLARLRDAALKADAGDVAGAAALWDQVADDASADRLLRDLASLLWVDHQLESGNPAALRQRLAPLIAPTNPWHPMAQEAMALLDMREGQNDQARTTLQGLTQDSGAPQGVRTRANGLLARLGG
jgi:hypothetical protein